MRINLIAVLLALAITTVVFGQDSSQLKRPDYKLAVAVNKNTVYEQDIKASPYVLPNNAIQLYPGETVFIEIEEDNGIIKKITATDKILNPDKTIKISFTQTAKKKVHELTMLIIENPFPYNLTYTAKIFPLLQQSWVDTKVYLVRSGLSAFEIWPDIIISIALENWEFKN